MDIGTRAFSLATALVLGASSIVFTAEPAAAEKKQDNGTRCGIDGGTLDPPEPEDHVFYMPGENVGAIDANGKFVILQCQADGTWKKVSMVRPRDPGRLQTGTVEQAP